MELGTPIWFDAGGEYPFPGRVTETYGGEADGVKVQCVADEKMYTITNPGKRIRIRHDALEIQHIDDMIQLRDLHEGSILFNLKTRFDKGLIYTYTGSILVAVNPYKLFDIYGIDTVKKYEGKPLGHLLPHLFAIGNSAYTRMMQTDKNQCVIISGESGAGKTESTKLIMQYLAAVNKSPSNLTTEQILEANPLLESFGNSKTVRNDNSSRFGKYTEVFFRKGVISGAKTTDYLLEKSRIVHQGPDERNYHVFYELLAGLSSPEAAKYGLRKAERYHFLNQGGSCRIEGKDDGEDFYRLVSAMEVLRFSPSEQDIIFGILAAILHLGNLNMKLGKNDQLVIQNENELSLAAKFLHLRLEELERAIIFRLTETRGERILTPRTLQQAIEARDGIAKSLYSSLFSWLVKSINSITGNDGSMTSIAILDIFGFEVFQSNSFEQMCINYANEHLQYFFNKHIFMMEQQEYLKEKIPWTNIEFSDNQQCIDMIGKRPFGVIHILDDESSFPNGTDKSFMDKCHYQHMGNAHYSRPKVHSMQFSIKHFAGAVTYDMVGFLEKNRDVLKPEVINMFINSHSQMISDIFVSLRRQEEQKAMMTSSTRAINSMRKLRASTVATRFNESLLDLISTMTKCNPFFVRCIKPNSDKAPMKYDEGLVLEQLRYSGMLETISIRKMGYPVRMSFLQFANRYRFLLGPVSFRASVKETCRTILDKAVQNASKDYVMGTSKVFMRESLETSLEQQRSRIISQAVVTIQTWVRRHQARQRFLRQREAAVLIQAQVRGRKQRVSYVKARRGVVLLQALHRGRMLRKRYKEMLIRRKKMLEEHAQREAEERARLQADAARRAEEEERRAKAADIGLLAVPMDLAVCMERLAGWSCPHGERNLNKTVGQVAHQDYMISFPLDINEHPLSRYINIYFKTPHFGVAMEPINTAFHKLNEVEDQDAVAVFKLILRFTMEEGLSKDKKVLIGNYIVQKGISNKALRDEIYSQLCNQTWMNPEPLVQERAWLLMSSLMSGFLPSKKLYKYLLKYVSDHAYDGYKSYCQQKLLMCDTQALEFQIPRTYPPCFLEWKANSQRCNMALVAELSDGEEATIMVDSWTTGEDFAKTAIQKKGITKACHGWSVHLMEDKHRYELSGYDYVMDLLSEMEIPPEFPVCESHFLVSSETVHERFPNRKFKIVRNNLAQIDALLEVDPAALSPNIPPSPNVPPPPPPPNVPPPPPPPNVPPPPPPPNAPLPPVSLPKTAPAGPRVPASSPPLVTRQPKQPPKGHRSPTRNDEVDPHALTPRQGESSQPIFPGYIHIPEPDYDMEDGPRQNEYDDTMPVAPASPIHPTLNSDVSEDESDHNHNVAQRIRNVSVPQSNSRLDDYVDRLFNPVLEMNEASDLSNARKVNKNLRGGGRGPTPTPPPFSPPPVPSQFPATGLPTSSMSMPGTAYPASVPLTAGFGSLQGVPIQPYTALPSMTGFPSMATTPVYTPGMMQPTLPAVPTMPPVMPMALPTMGMQAMGMPAAMPVPTPMMMPHQPTMLEAAIQQQQAAAMQQQRQQQEVAAMQQQRQQQEAMMQQQAIMNQQTIMAQQMQLQHQQSMLQSMHSQLSDTTPTSTATTLKSALTKTSSGRYRPSNKEAVPVSQKSREKNIQFSDRVVNIPVETVGEATSSLLKSDSWRADPLSPTAAPGLAPPPPPPPPLPPSPPSESGDMVTVRTRSGKVVPLNDSYRANTIRIGQVVWPPRKEGQKSPAASAVETGQKSSHFDRPSSEIKRAIKAANHQLDVKQKTSLETLISNRAKQFGRVPDEVARPVPSPLRAPPPIKPKKFSPRPAPNKLNVENAHAEAMAKILARKAVLDRQQPLSPPVSPASPPPVSPPPSAHKQAPPLPPPPPPVSTIRDKAEMFQKAEPLVRSESKREPPRRIVSKKKEVHHEAMHILHSHGHHVIMPNTDYNQEVVVPRMSSEDIKQLESPRTKACPAIPDVFYAYNRVRWRLHIRKEVFTPGERLDNPMAQQLIFYQIVTDTFSKSCIRLSMREKRQVRAMLDDQGVNPQNVAQKTKMRKDVIEVVRKFPFYFSRFYPVTGGRKNPQIEILGISENGISLIKREYDQTKDQLSQLDHILFSDIRQIEVSTSGTIRFTLTNNKVIPLFTHRAYQIKNTVEAYIIDLEKDSQYMRAIQDYITRESTLLSFRKGDIIKLTTRHPAADSDWLFGMLDGCTGFFPKESVIPAPGPDTRNLLVRRGITTDLIVSNPEEVIRRQKQETPKSPVNVTQRQLSQEELNRFSMLEFASKYFRDYQNKYVMQRKEDGSIRGSLKFMGNLKKSLKKSTKKKPSRADQQDLSQFLDAVSYTNSPIQASLLDYPAPAINKLALECFLALMQIMGDYPLSAKPGSPLHKAVYEKIAFIIKVCFGHREISDEIYCHVIKQTTRNSSSKKFSLLHGWHFFALLTTIFQCSPIFKPYLLQYLTMVAQTAGFQFGALAALCLFNLRKTFRYGGRCLLPGPEEVENFMAGRMIRRHQIYLPGNMRTTIKMSSCTVVWDILEELCTEMGIQQAAAIEEFAIFGLVSRENRVVPLQHGDYLMDVMTQFDSQGFEYVFLCKRAMWYQPTHINNSFHSAILYNQLLPDYQSGRLVVLEGDVLTEHLQSTVVRLAVLQHRAADQVQIPTLKDLPELVPALVLSHMNQQQWLNLIHADLPLLESTSPHEARTQFVNTLLGWPLFGSSFFDITYVSDSRIGGECLLAINKAGIHFLHPQTHECLLSNNFEEVVSSRYLRGNDGRKYVDLKCGNLMVQKVTRLQSSQCTEIINLIGQHIQSQLASKYEPQPSANITEFDGVSSPKYPPSHGQETPQNPAKRWGGVATPLQEMSKQSSNIARSPSRISQGMSSPSGFSIQTPPPSAPSPDRGPGVSSPETHGSPRRKQEAAASPGAEGLFLQPNKVRQLDSNWLLAPKEAVRGHARGPSWDRSSGSSSTSQEGDVHQNRSSPIPPASQENILKMGFPRSAAARQSAIKAGQAGRQALGNGHLQRNQSGRQAAIPSPGFHFGRT